MKRFEEIPHTADWSFRAFGRDLRELFANAAFAMFALEGAIPTPEGAAGISRRIVVEGIDYESLLVNWLSELLYWQEQERETYQRFQIEEISPTALQAIVFGTPRGKIEKIIKAATYHNLKIEQTPEGWQVVVVVDV
ncbi:MAG: archease [Chloroflexi bacterium]|nr:archease [Chloroflexota bacterium]